MTPNPPTPEFDVWKVLIGEMLLVNNEIDQLDPEHIEDYTAPRAPASPQDLEAFEAHLGERLPDEYRNYLLTSNGWPSFYMDAILFGLPELRGDTVEATVASKVLDVYDEEEVFDDIGIPRSDILPICAGRRMRTVFAIVRIGRPHAGKVLWLDAEEIDRFEGFIEFFASMRGYARERADKLRQA